MVNYMFNSDDGVDNSPAYETMLEFAREQLLKREPNEAAQQSGAYYDKSANMFKLVSLNQKIEIHLPTCGAFFEDNKKPPWAWHLIILHYLSEANGTPPGDSLMTFRTQEGGFIRGAGFDRESAAIISEQFANKPAVNVKKACEELGAVLKPSNADLCAVFWFLPNYPITLQVWEADDEMPGSGQLLISSNAYHYLSVEDAITAGSIILNCLENQYVQMFKGCDCI